VAPITDEETAAAVGQSWLRLTEVFTQDGFYTFSDPEVMVMTAADGSITVLEEVWVKQGGKGGILVALEMDADGDLSDVVEVRAVQIGARPL
jgi:hypothetical protein